MIKKVTDNEAEILINNFKNGNEIYDQERNCKGKVILIEKGICKVKYENGDIEVIKNPFFCKDIVNKETVINKD